MFEKLSYYWDLFVTLCTTGEVADITWFDVLLVTCAFISVIWAFYQAMVYLVRPDEASPLHIKRQILKGD